MYSKGVDTYVMSGRLLPRCLRVEQIIIGVLKVGYLDDPVLVNENFEIIDGQGRVEALKILGFPIRYIVQEGKGLFECIEMNTKSIRWNTQDYILSYADLGDPNFKLLVSMQETYEYLNCNSIGYILFGTPIRSDEVKAGKLHITPELYAECKPYLEWTNKMAIRISKIEISKRNKHMNKNKQRERLVCALASFKHYVKIDKVDKVKRSETLPNVVEVSRLNLILPRLFEEDKTYTWDDIPSAIHWLSEEYDKDREKALLDIESLYKNYVTNRKNKNRKY